MLSGAAGQVRRGLAVLRRAGLAAFVVLAPETPTIRPVGTAADAGPGAAPLVNALAAMVLSRGNAQPRAPG